MAGGAELLLINAAIGGATSAVAGGDPLKGALLGAVGGGIMGGLSGGAAAPGTGLSAVPSAASTATGATNYALAAPSAAGAGGVGLAAPTASTALTTPGLGTAVDYSLGAATSPLASLGVVGLVPPSSALATTAPTTSTALAAPAADKGMFGGLKDWWGSLSGKEKLLYGGGAGIGALMLSESMGAGEPPSGEYKGPLRKYKFDPFGYSRSVYAEGGITSLANGGYDRTVGEMPQYQAMASGGISDLGSYSDGGRMLRGPGDGMSDNIPGVIGGKRPARLADGEFVVPADVVSHLGNGSTDAGAKQLYAMMDRVRKQRTGTKKQGRQINPMRAMPA